MSDAKRGVVYVCCFVDWLWGHTSPRAKAQKPMDMIRRERLCCSLPGVMGGESLIEGEALLL